MARRLDPVERKAELALSERQREWLRHLRACERSGETIRQYGERKGLSVHRLYSARKRLRGLGISFGSPRRSCGVSFAKVTLGEAAVRVHFPNGAVVEWNAPLGGEQAKELLQAIAQLQ